MTRPDPPPTPPPPGTWLVDGALGVLLFVVVILSLLFSTGEDTSFIYIDF